MIAEIALDMFQGSLSSPPNCFSSFSIAVGESAALSTTSLRMLSKTDEEKPKLMMFMFQKMARC
jgi:hypothetical protein